MRIVTIEEVAQVCHEANRAYCETIEDFSQKPWRDAEPWQKDSATRGVLFAIGHRQAPASAQHDAWLADKLRDGWKFGPVKDAGKKEHPCCVPYADLPDEQKFKDSLFRAIVHAFLDSPEVEIVLVRA